MLVTIESYSKSMSGNWSVTFLSPYGQGEAEWRGQPPTLGQQYSVELELPQPLAWGQEITPASDPTPAVGTEEDGHFMVALVEQVDEDGCVTVRVGSSIVLLETTGMATVVGGYIRVRFDRLILFDTGL